MRIGIRKLSSVSHIGLDVDDVKAAYSRATPAFSFSNGHYFAPLHQSAEKAVEQLLTEYPRYGELDRTIHLGILAVEKALQGTDQSTLKNIPLHVGSSRGATTVWEHFHQAFLNQGKLSPKASPLTTAGNISSHIAHHFMLDNAVFDHSLTCSSGMQSLSNGFAWLKSGLCEQFLAVASEAALTDFTKAQVASLGISAKPDKYPCQPLSKKASKQNTMVLGEAAVAVLLEKENSTASYPAYLCGIGYGMEKPASPTGISADGKAFQKAMQNALNMAGIANPDLIICHAPGTYYGDRAEINAIHQLFGEIPLASTKFLTGHTYGTSGLLSLELALLLLDGFDAFYFPYQIECPQLPPNPKTILINTIGFGGNACSVLVGKD